MADQVLIQFRADKELKQEVTEIYESLGLDLPTALRMFMYRSKMMKGLPFEAKLPESYAIHEIRQIDSAIAEAEAEYGKTGEVLDATKTFTELRRKHFEEL